MSRRRAFDTNYLIQGWKDGRRRPLAEHTIADAVTWVDELIRIHRTNAIVTPVEIEFLCDVTRSHESDLARAFLSRFEIADQGHVLDSDWEQARRFAQWVKGELLARQLGDCLIVAITKRLQLELLTRDQGIPRGNPL